MTNHTPKRTDFREIVETVHRQSAFPNHLGVELIRVDPGEIEGTLTARPEYLQHTGVMHAGALITFLDHLAGLAAISLAPVGQTILSVNLNVSMLRPSTAQLYRCIARVVKAGRQIYVVDCSVTGEGEARTVESVRATITLMAVLE